MVDRIYISIGEMTYYVDTDIVILAAFALLFFFLLLLIVTLRSLARSSHGKKRRAAGQRKGRPCPGKRLLATLSRRSGKTGYAHTARPSIPLATGSAAPAGSMSGSEVEKCFANFAGEKSPRTPGGVPNAGNARRTAGAEMAFGTFWRSRTPLNPGTTAQG